MASRKKKKVSPVSKTEAPPDQHKVTKQFRVDDDLHRGIKLLAERNDRPMSREFRAAIVRHLRENNMWPVPTPVSSEDE